MTFKSYIPRTGMRIPMEQSRFASFREPNAMGHLYKSVAQGNNRDTNLTNLVGMLQRQVNALAQKGTAPGKLSPFEIYQFPEQYRNFKNANDWQRFKVRGGDVSFAGISGSLKRVQGTDQSNFGGLLFNNPQQAYLQSNNGYPFQVPPGDSANINVGWNEAIVANDGFEYFFWVSICVAEAAGLPNFLWPVLMFGKDLDTAIEMVGGTHINDPWPTFPYDDPYHRMVGSVIIDSRGIPYINQDQNIVMDFPIAEYAFSTSDLRPIANCRMLGEYSDEVGYYYGDVVTDIQGPPNTLSQYVYLPTNDVTTAYPFTEGPITAIQPFTNNPDPWRLLSRSFIDADYHNGAYDGTKYYLRTV